MTTILVIEDEKSIRDEVLDWLRFENYQVLEAENGRVGLTLAQQNKPDLILCDIAMPEMDGHEVLLEVRSNPELSHLPFIFLTASADRDSMRQGMNLGADDYLTKPFSMRELAARVRAVLRRLDKGGGVGPSALLRTGDLTLDRDRREVTVGPASVDLTPSEFDLLATFLSAPGRVFSRLELLDKLQGDAYEGYERTIDVHIRNLRAKIEPDPRNPRYIVTVYGIGYRLAVEPIPA